MNAAQQERLRQYLLGLHQRLSVPAPDSREPGRVIAHLAELNGRALEGVEFAIAELGQK